MKYLLTEFIFMQLKHSSCVLKFHNIFIATLFVSTVRGKRLGVIE
jgi:hypothetical protein